MVNVFSREDELGLREPHFPFSHDSYILMILANLVDSAGKFSGEADSTEYRMLYHVSTAHCPGVINIPLHVLVRILICPTFEHPGLATSSLECICVSFVVRLS